MSYTAVGFFGKLPCRGDFLQRRVERDFIEVWDVWLQRCIEESNRQLRERWLGSYLTGPVWRFVVAEGICGPRAYAGVIVPSVDRVGRYFPLTIVAEWPAQECTLEAAMEARAWFDSAEAVALTAPEASDLDAFDAQVAKLSALLDTRGATESAHLRSLLAHTDFPQRSTQWHFPLASVHSLQRAVNALALRELERSLRPVSLWWSDGSDNVEPAWLCARGLPAPETFAAMLSGEWTTVGWSSLGSGLARQAPPQQAQELRFAVAHEPIDRQWGAAPPSALFTARPEVGLWGVASVLDAERGPAVAEALMDVLQSVRPTGSLSALVEEVRGRLEAVQQQFARQSLALDGTLSVTASAIVLAASGAECALICSGPVQAVRYRASEVTPVVGVGPYDAMSARAPMRDAAAVNGTLLDLVTGSAVPCMSPQELLQARVCYESLQAGDAWFIAGEPVFEERRLPWLAAGLKQGAEDPVAVVRTTCGAEMVDRNPLPVLLLSARAMQPHSAAPDVITANQG